MPHNDNTFSGKTSLDNIDDVYFKIVNVEENLPGFDTWFALGFGDVVTDYITEFPGDFFDRSNLPDWDQFSQQVADRSPGLTQQQVEDEFLKGYRFLLFTDEDRANIDLNAEPGNDWELLTAAGVVDASKMREQFINAFNHFMEDFPPDESGGTNTPVSAVEFKRTFENFMARSTLLENVSLNDLPEEQTEFVNVELIGSYEELFDAFFPLKGLTVEERREVYETIVVTFANEMVAKEGYFIPTQSFDEWALFLEKQAQLRIFGKETTLASIGAEQVLILDRIFLLLVRMIDVLQEVAAVQSDRLLFYTEWQKAYTEQIDQIPVFVVEDGSLIGNDNTKSSEKRVELNQLNTSYKERLTANRQVISDDAKAMQSAVNQSTDAVTQQANIATAILEQLSTLLSAIFR